MTKKYLDKREWKDCDSCEKRFLCLSKSAEAPLIVGGIITDISHACSTCINATFDSDNRGKQTMCGYCTKKQAFISPLNTCPHWVGNSSSLEVSGQAISMYCAYRNICYSNEAKKALDHE